MYSAPTSPWSIFNAHRWSIFSARQHTDAITTPTTYNWTHLDRLGSPIAISDDTGALKEKLAYDAWGKRRTLDGAPISGSATPDTIDGQTDNKGFTGHEMLDQLDLVHMNGRVYDPLTARFLSGDPLIQDPVNGQNYNRYAYVLNNPTNLTDPTGFSCATEGATEGCSGQGISTVGFTTCSGNCLPQTFTMNITGSDGTVISRYIVDQKQVASKPVESADRQDKKDAKNPGSDGNGGNAANGGTSLDCQTSIDCKGNGNGYDKTDPNHHDYFVDNKVCSYSTPKCDASNAYDATTKNAAPGSDGKTSVQTGDKTSIVFLGINGGHVTHIADPDNVRVINITDDDHIFHNGVVIRAVVDKVDGIHIISNGEGVNRPNSLLPDALSKFINLLTANPGFNSLDLKIRDDILNRSPEGKAIIRQEIIEQARRKPGEF